MIFILGSLGSGLNKAWQYIQSGVVSGVQSSIEIARTVAEGLKEDYTEVLAGVSTVEDIERGFTKLADIPDFYSVTSEFAAETTFDYEQNHVMKMKVHGTDKATGLNVDSWVTVESKTGLNADGRKMTKQDWFNSAQEGVFESPFGYSWDLDYADEFEYYIKEIE